MRPGPPINVAGVLGTLTLLSGARAAGWTVSLSATDPALVCGARVTPDLRLGTPPAGTKSLAVIFWDERPGGLSGRWSVFDLPLGTARLAPGAAPGAAARPAPGGGRVTRNEAGQLSYTAPCGKGKHDLYVDLYALDVPSLNLPAGTPLQQVHAAIKRHRILEAKAHVTRVNP
ncbi:hypothetical protein [Deinococcus aestuarii]|uniref:hypothetical protein n=1 Tax=Deinococcus aestuarii TaxID=2774531 RepID=UPI001C0C5E69|nr:hypothetical protein [Deinococcus aestuarii]